MTEEFTYKGQQISYLGFLETQLRELQGIDSLAYELIQNADDVRGVDGQPGSSWISFDVRDEALVVANDGVFRPVDFERLQTIAGGGKRAEVGTTGAFGLGFLAVYQVTDAPEIFSGDRHWTIRPDAVAAERIQERAAETSGTRLRLPWALDPGSEVRQTLRLPAIDQDKLDGLAQALAQAVELAAVFLRQLQVLEVKRNGQVVRRIEREETGMAEAEGRRLRLRDEQGESATWLLFERTFAADELAVRYAGQIEAARSGRVRLALPLERVIRPGRLFAGLPTEVKTPLPLHIDAEFYPTSDRKRIHLDEGYQAAWNVAALRAAAEMLAGQLESIRRQLEPSAFWHLLQQSYATQVLAGQGELPAIFAIFWEALTPLFDELPLLFTIDERWVVLAEGRVPERLPEEPTLSLLLALQVPVAHPVLAPYFELMRTPEVEVPPLALTDVVEALLRAGLSRSMPLDQAPTFLASAAQWQVLWRLLGQLAEAYAAPAVRARERQVLGQVALVLSDRMTLERPERVFRGSAEARALFPEVAWVYPPALEGPGPGWLVEEFGVRQAVTWLGEQPVNQLEEAWRMGWLDVPRLFRWLEAQQIEIFADDPALQHEIRRLPLVPVAGELRPLRTLYLPGGFEDPLGLAGMLPLAAVGGRRQFLEDLGAETLSFERYVHDVLPRVLSGEVDLGADAQHRLLRLLAERLGELRDDEVLQEQLGHLPLVPCLDGSFRPAVEVYAMREAFELLGEGTQVAEPAPTEAVEALYQWLGVRDRPGAEALVRRLGKLQEEVGDEVGPAEAVKTARACWQRLQALLEVDELDGATLAPLRGRAVIPVGPEELARPEAVFLADVPDLAARFSGLEAWLVETGQEEAPAWLLAGVRPLSEAVTVEVVTPAGREAAPGLQGRLAERAPLIRRIARAEAQAEDDRQWPDRLRVVAAESLQVRYRLATPAGTRVSAPEAVKAFLNLAGGVLYVQSGPPPWLAIAREVAQAISPARVAGGMALALREVLSAESVTEAGAMLDELGYPE